MNPDLGVRDREGDIYTVRYDAVNTMLLNEFLKARRQIDAQQKKIDALTAGLQKVNAQVEVRTPGSAEPYIFSLIKSLINWLGGVHSKDLVRLSRALSGRHLTLGESFDGNVSKLGRVVHDVPLDGNGA